jgi:hypothetical protein
MAGADDTTYGPSVFSEDNLQDRIRKYAQDDKNLNFMVLHVKEPISFLKVISEKFGTLPQTSIKDFELKYPEIYELPYEFTLGVASSDVDGTKKSALAIADDDAPGLHPGQTLYVRGMYTNATGTQLGLTKTADRRLNEIVMIEDVGRSGSFSTGYTNVVVARMYPNDSPSATLVQIPINTVVVLNNSISAEDALPNPPVSKTSDSEYNYIQTMRESYGVSEHIKSGIETFLSKEPLDMQYELCEARYLTIMELAMISARRSKKKINGKVLYQTGGLLEFIPTDAAHTISFNQVITPDSFTWLTEQIGDTAGSGVSELWMFCGTDYYTSLNLAHANKMTMNIDQASSIKYNITVKEYANSSRAQNFKIVPAPILNILDMSSEAVVLNLSDKWKCFQIAEKKPLVDLPDDKDSLSANGQYNTWRELYSMWGLIRRRADTQFRVVDTIISQ